MDAGAAHERARGPRVAQHGCVGLDCARGENGALLDRGGDAPTLLACIAAGDALGKRLLPALTEARLREPWPGDDARSIGMALIEEGDHAALHHGQMQLTRHL